MDFNQVARQWDDAGRVARAQIIADEIKKVLKLESRTIQSAMEFGCGTGLISFQLQNAIKSITLIDTASEMVRVVKENIQVGNARHMAAVCCDLLQEEISEQYDLIYTSMALHHVFAVEALCQKFYGHLSNGGVLCIVDLNPDDGSFHRLENDFTGHHGFEQDQFRGMLEKIGYDQVSSHTFYEDVKSVEDRKVPYSLFIMVAYKNRSF